MPENPDFSVDALELGAQKLPLTDAETDALPYGLLETDWTGKVLRYNATESRYSGLSRDRVVSRHFFRDVAPCSNIRHVAGRHERFELDESLAYTFALRINSIPVTLRLLKPASGARMCLLVRRT